MTAVLPSELESLRDWLRYAISRFAAQALYFGHGSASAYDEAAYLLLHALHLPLDRLDPFLDAKLTHAEREKMHHLIERRVEERVPAAYLTHEAWLGEFKFYVDPRVIIPRSFIAELIPDALTPWLPDPSAVQTVLDLCTGCGCLAILAAHHFANADVDAVDVAVDALTVAQKNVADYDLQDRINLIRSDLFSNLTEKTYDLIISNPPYVTTLDMETLPPEYRHEPELALAGGDEGLDAVRVILSEAERFLKPDGVLVVEIGHHREAVEQAYPTLPFVWLATESSDNKVFLLRREDFHSHPLELDRGPL